MDQIKVFKIEDTWYSYSKKPLKFTLNPSNEKSLHSLAASTSSARNVYPARDSPSPIDDKSHVQLLDLNEAQEIPSDAQNLPPVRDSPSPIDDKSHIQLFDLNEAKEIPSDAQKLNPSIDLASCSTHILPHDPDKLPEIISAVQNLSSTTVSSSFSDDQTDLLPHDTNISEIPSVAQILPSHAVIASYSDDESELLPYDCSQVVTSTRTKSKKAQHRNAKSMKNSLVKEKKKELSTKTLPDTNSSFRKILPMPLLRERLTQKKTNPIVIQPPTKIIQKKSNPIILPPTETNLFNPKMPLRKIIPKPLCQDDPTRPLVMVILKQQGEENRCFVCEKLFNTTNELALHVKVHESRYLCNICKSEFLTDNALKEHIDSAHSNKKQKCDICKKVVANIVEHSNEYLDKKKCCICKQDFLAATYLKAHIRNVHKFYQPDQSLPDNPVEEKIPETCKTCKKTFDDLLKHEKDYVEDKKCCICERKFAASNSLRAHISSVHEKVLPYECKDCKKKFPTKYRLDMHAFVHVPADQAKNCICKICDRAYVSMSLLLRHMVSHGEKKFQCDRCDKSFLYKSELKQHKMMHDNTFPFKCSECDKTFSTEKRSINHQITHSGKTDFMCKICGKAFRYEGNLKIHLHLHTNERPYSCDQCDISFKTEWYLKKHIKAVHCKVKNLQCHICSKTFSNKGYLKCHLQTHSDEKAFKCEVCQKQFKTANYLKFHMESHTGNKYFCKLCNKGFTRKLYLYSHSKTHKKNQKKDVNVDSPTGNQDIIF